MQIPCKKNDKFPQQDYVSFGVRRGARTDFVFPRIFDEHMSINF